jgi:hypothetical protein
MCFWTTWKWPVCAGGIPLWSHGGKFGKAFRMRSNLNLARGPQPFSSVPAGWVRSAAALRDAARSIDARGARLPAIRDGIDRASLDPAFDPRHFATEHMKIPDTQICKSRMQTDFYTIFDSSGHCDSDLVCRAPRRPPQDPRGCR